MLATVLIMTLMLSSQVTTGTVGILGTTFDYESLIDQYKPSLRFMHDEQYFPVDFYFDGNMNIDDNRQHYEEQIGTWDTYVVFAHAKDNVYIYTPDPIGPFIAIEYWYYYVADSDQGIYPGHDQDWELHFEILIWQSTHNPYKARTGVHGYFWEGWALWPSIEKDNGHPIVYVDLKHASHFYEPWGWNTGFYLHWYNSKYKISSI